MARKINLTELFRAAAVLFFAVLVGGCGSFNHDWEHALRQPVAASEIEGPWQGIWHSDSNGHQGKLRCILSRKGDGTYRARFHARYGKLLGFGYTASLKTEPATNGYTFTGQANLGFLAGGVYYYDGHANQTNFFSTYSCRYDHGTFEMKRPAVEAHNISR
jgi:hypothetical protein